MPHFRFKYRRDKRNETKQKSVITARLLPRAPDPERPSAPGRMPFWFPSCLEKKTPLLALHLYPSHSNLLRYWHHVLHLRRCNIYIYMFKRDRYRVLTGMPRGLSLMSRVRNRPPGVLSEHECSLNFTTRRPVYDRTFAGVVVLFCKSQASVWCTQL